MFIQNKYYTWYQNIIQKAQNRQLPPEIYRERHHVIPRCMGGSNCQSNIAVLTAKEHFLCHLLLVKFVQSTTHKFKMMSAVSKFMSSTAYQKRILSSRQYQLCREYARESAVYFASLRGPRSLESIEKAKKTCMERYGANNSRLGAILSDEQKINLSKLRKSRPTYESWFLKADAEAQRNQHSEWAKKYSNFVSNNPSNTEEGRRQISMTKSAYIYVTPWGNFCCRYDFDQHPVCSRIGFDTVYRLYGGLNATIKTRAINRANLPLEWKNKTWKDVGFDQISK